MRMRRALSTAVATAVALALLPALPAAAADEVQLSTDGTSWASTLSAPLFDSADDMVPRESVSETLWVRNASTTEVALRLTLESGTWSDADYANALTVSATATGGTGSSVVASAPGSCRLLLTGVRLAPGASAPVTVTLALGDLTDRLGQDATASLTLGVTVVETSGTTPAADCTTPAVAVPLTPRAPRPAAAATPEPTATPTPTPTATQAPSQPAEPPILAFLSGALLGFDASALLWALIAALAGGALFYLAELLPWRRRDSLKGKD